MNKPMILKALLAELEEELRRLQAANEQASAGATDSEARAETKWDTCGLESSYLARGHAQQFKALAADVHNLRGFVAPDYSGRLIGIGALVEVEMGGEAMLFFLLHCGGGIDLAVEGREVTVITPESPVGTALLDRQPSDTFSFRAGVEGKILRVE
ncbi:MAG: transcription elongation factor GreAB [Verrucomicrobiota bacterium]